MEFHKAIVRAANNPVLTEMHGAILARLWRARYLSATRKASRARVLVQHDAIVAGLVARDTEQVEQALGVHLEHVPHNVEDYSPKARAAIKGAAGPRKRIWNRPGKVQIR